MSWFKYFLKLDRWLRGLNAIYLILIAFVLMLLVSVLITSFFQTKTELNIDRHWLYQLILAVILAPFLETLLFQKIPIDVGSYLQKQMLNKVYPIVNILLSSLVFAIMHPYNIGYLISAFLFGFIFSYVYIIRSNATYFSSFTTVCTLHMTWNLLVFVGKQL